MANLSIRGSPKLQNTVSKTSSSPPPAITLPSLSQPTSSSSISLSSSSSSATPSLTTIMAVTSTVPPGARSTSPCSAATAGGPYGQPTPSTPTGSSGRCCDTGRTIFTDPVTGQTLCSCQYDLLNYPRLAAAGAGIPVGPGGVPLGVYPESVAAYLSSMGADQPPFYPNPAGLDLKENLVGGGAPWPYPSVYHPYDTAFAAYPFNSYGMDLNGARRKNATRETTSTLKAWLNEHKKNPYPTKGEKIMLAIITKMTLTQVSTWFANARRRLKKENKMTWEPRNRVDDDDAALDDDDKDDDKDLLDAKDSGTGSTESNRLDVLDRPEGNSEWSGSRPGSANGSPDLYDHHPMHHSRHPGPHPHPLLHPAALQHFRPPAGSPPDSHHLSHLSHHHSHHHTVNALNALTSATNSNINKPRIWSLADMASKESKDGNTSSSNSNNLTSTSSSNSNSNNNNNNNNNSDSIPPPSSLYSHPSQHSSPGKILSPLAARIPNYPPYGRPDLYRGFYGAAAAHLGGPTSAEFLDHHQRSFQASLAAHHSMNPLLWKAAVTAGAAAASGAPPFAPLSLTTNNHHNNNIAPQPGASPSASSTSSSIGPNDSINNNNNSLSLQQQQQQNSIQHISGNSSTSSGSTSGRISPGISSNGSKP